MEEIRGRARQEDRDEMSDKPTMVYFVTWPDGKVFERTQTSVSEDIAIARAILTWLIPENFPGLELGGQWGGGPMRELWAAMKRAGFKVHGLEIPANGVSY